MSGRTKFAGIDFPRNLTGSILLVASCCDRFWCETGAVIAGIELWFAASALRAEEARQTTGHLVTVRSQESTEGKGP
jgi:hypothetical protein